jgi:tetratricopeptide (TPR) repeat protein
LRRVVARQPVNQAAWLWLSALSPERAEAEAALAQARKINPTHPSLARADQWLAKRFSANPPTRLTHPEPPAPAPAETRQDDMWNRVGLGLVIGALLIAVAVLFVGLGLQLNTVAKAARPVPEPTAAPNPLTAYAPILQLAQAGKNWSQVVAILEPLYQANPDAEDIKAQLTAAYAQKGLLLRHKGFIEEARPNFEKALKVWPANSLARQELELAVTYLDGVHQYQAGQWPAAIAALETIRRVDAAYINLNDLLYSATYNQGLAAQAAGDLTAARAAFDSALALRPDLPDPRRQLARLDFDQAPTTPLHTPLGTGQAGKQLVVVGIAEQRMLVFDDMQPVFDFVVSTGEPGRDTAIGEFEILDKIDMAYASTWNLDMPYWMGIYWSGPLENGIHSLPIVKHTGYKLWDGYLGQRVSYGCVILGDEDAATLFEWAQIGAKVKIVPNLADWLAQNGLSQ